ncbi:hypothetical protein HPP92_003730 [Vanilla planifolia]|uniref:Lipoxygenase n=1 Tax=Vanilla planifolia TaxID=51239 RepID=A0A835SHA0_VANPL|nr:hypothetical protein HPP92_003730 [Vanilla planifolia]
MALQSEIAAFSLLDRSSLLPDLKTVKLGSKHSSSLCFNYHVRTPVRRTSSGSLRSIRPPAATISEEVLSLVVGKPVKIKVRAAVTVRRKNKEDFREAIANQVDALSEKIGRNVVLELISTEISNRAKVPKKSGEAVIKDWYEKRRAKGERVVYTVEFTVDSSFGEPGAVVVINRHQREFFLESVVVEGFPCGPVCFPCNSWVQSTKDLPSKRVFFSNKSYLPQETPEGLKELREKELLGLRGDGKGIRRLSDRIYDYATYNDLGNPDKDKDLARPILGGEKTPYPRRCRTGRPPTDTNLLCESRIEKPHPIYVPRDETFEELKQDAVLRRKVEGEDKFAWLRDDEFARHAVAGINPVNIERVKVFPPVSTLDREIYGPPASAITENHIAGHLNGMSVDQAVEEGKLFMLDHHDIYLPFVNRINALDGRKAYATRTLFFLSPKGTLKPVAIELALPPTVPGNDRRYRVLTPPCDATTSWLWQMGKAHVSANDCGVHQLVNHWLRTHAAMEPFILAAHRRLSAMHPVFRLLHPHMRYTLEINALARQSLINAGGVIEECFTPGPLCMEMSAAYYGSRWRIDQEGLPADLIRRGVAVEDHTQPHGVRLLLEDYPYAEDGLLIWSAIDRWVSFYIDRWYPDSAAIRSDDELQSWYMECIDSGHADVRYEPWWPKIATPAELAHFLTTLIWLASAQHAALNFGQYPLGGYVPSRPPLMRRLLPDGDEDPEGYADFISDPHRYFLSALPSVLQATKFMAVVDTLSTHSPDEEYLGGKRDVAWAAEAELIEGYGEFAAEIARIEEEIERRNSDPLRRNRCGAGVLPYELLMPSSPPGVTCRGVPNSISI